MKKECEIIKDLLPLYVDEVCSKESARIVEEHLKACNDCTECYNNMCSNENEKALEAETATIIEHHEKKEAKRIGTKIILCIIAFTALMAVALKISIDIKYRALLNEPPVIEYGESTIYTREEMESAIAVIKSWGELLERNRYLSISYIDDKTSLEKLEHCNTLASYQSGNSNTYDQCIVFSVVVQTVQDGFNVFKPQSDMRREYWYLARSENGGWVFVDNAVDPYYYLEQYNSLSEN